MTEDDLAPLREAAAKGRDAYRDAFMERVLGDPRLTPHAPVLLYRTLPLAPEVKEGAVLLGLALKAAMEHPEPLARAGFDGDPVAAGEKLFEAMLASPSGLVFAVDEWREVLGRVSTPDGRIQLALDDLLTELDRVVAQPAPARDEAFPFVLSAGERRSFTANTILRDPAWRKQDADGALRIGVDDAKALGVRTGDRVKLSTKRGSAIVQVEVTDSMQRGHVALPNGLGTHYPADGGEVLPGVAPNELTSFDERDPFVGTPWHKSVPARVERVSL